MVQSYQIGRLILHPHRELLDRGVPVPIGGRALDLLSVLAAADGGVLTKDELLATVWNGAIVEENALQAQISAARKALGGEAVRLVTIHRHGYRLDLEAASALGGFPSSAELACDTLVNAAPPVTRQSAAPDAANTGGAPDKPVRRLQWQFTRRTAAAAIAAAGFGITTAFALRSRKHVPNPRALELYHRGRLLEQNGEFKALGQAKDLYRQSVTIDAKFAEAWGRLAIVQRNVLVWGVETPFGDPILVRDAANRALALDPDNTDAQLALILLYPQYRHWLSHEKALRALLTTHGDFASDHGSLAGLLLDVGRLEQAILHANAAKELDPAPAPAWFCLGFAHIIAGRYDEAELALEQAFQISPQLTDIWGLRYWSLVARAQYAEAAAIALDSSRRPHLISPDLAHSMASLAQDLMTEAGRARLRSLYRSGSIPVENIQISSIPMVQLGLIDETFAALDAYYFGNHRIAPPGPSDRRETVLLFSQAHQALRNDPRWPALLDRVGLEDYWRKSGSQPDFRGVNSP